MVLLVLAILNSFHLYKIKSQKTSNVAITQLQYRISVVRWLLEQNLQENLSSYSVRRERP
jgi:hypothetical protein